MLMHPEDNTESNPGSVHQDSQPVQKLPKTNLADSGISAHGQTQPAQNPTSGVLPTEHFNASSAKEHTAAAPQVITGTDPTPASNTQPQVVHTNPTTKKSHHYKKFILIGILVLFFGLAVTGAYLFGKHHERIIVQKPPAQPINLPPQTVLVSDCVPGRGKQYILPKDIPLGPVYDVNNNKVIAVEYTFKASDLFVNGSKLSDTLIPFFKGNYQTEYFTITPGTLQAGQSQADTPINVAIFVVPKSESSGIKCAAKPT